MFLDRFISILPVSHFLILVLLTSFPYFVLLLFLPLPLNLILLLLLFFLFHFLSLLLLLQHLFFFCFSISQLLLLLSYPPPLLPTTSNTHSTPFSFHLPGGSILAKSTNGEGGYSFIDTSRALPAFSKSFTGYNKAGPGYLLIVPAIPGCECDYRCLALDETRSQVACVCPANWKLNGDGKTCMRKG